MVGNALTPAAQIRGDLGLLVRELGVLVSSLQLRRLALGPDSGWKRELTAQ